MSKINIQGQNNIDDPFYRYKMEKLNIINQKNKTVIDNLKKVCDDLGVDPTLLYSFFKKKFSISMNMDKNFILSTAAKLSYGDFEKALREFIDIYVLCNQCKLPELTIVVEKDKMSRTCRSCSFIDCIKK